VFSFLLGQKNLGLTDIAKATITEDTVRLNYVHGIWYQVCVARLSLPSLLVQLLPRQLA
jgi:hypothetical protein